jgi:hypothetical protein
LNPKKEEMERETETRWEYKLNFAKERQTVSLSLTMKDNPSLPLKDNEKETHWEKQLEKLTEMKFWNPKEKKSEELMEKQREQKKDQKRENLGDHR